MADPLLSQYGWGAAATYAKRRNPAPQSAATTRTQQQSAARSQPYAKYGLGAAGTAAKPQIGDALGPVVLPETKPSGPPAGAYDYSSDPILLQIQASSAKARSDAQTAALEARKRAAIRFGDATGIVDDEGTREAARGNSFSTLAELARAYQRGVEGIDEATNKRNLFFSGYRGKLLGRQLEERNRQEYGARNELQDYLSGVGRDLTAALLAADTAEQEGETGAYERAINRALTYGIDPGQAPAPAAAPAVPAGLPPIPAALLAPEQPAPFPILKGANPLLYFK